MMDVWCYTKLVPLIVAFYSPTVYETLVRKFFFTITLDLTCSGQFDRDWLGVWGFSLAV
jgi:hypothetical protein